ncbi:MAG TPA: dTMP kinase [Actinomycetota bacterium]|nr:dTMP kinase [Actinomycetota bacterium]
MLRRNNPGFLVVEGMDGTGTTTQAAALTDALTASDQRVRCTAEPSGGPLGELLRSYVRLGFELDPVALTLLFTADRADHLAGTVRPALAEGTTVVCDRYLLSTLAYQGAQGVDRNWILDISRPFEVPDLTVVLTLREEERAARIDGRGARDRFEDPRLAVALRESYAGSIELLRAAGHRVELVDASGSPQEVTRRILSLWQGSVQIDGA